ncbi:MAG: 1-phosphofructokinase family hexose kinase [Erysipelotrichaceae bacterium]|nr:1-phosphofructokinase family hexose kinase [Erysipelotrichaceae bacterium]
MIYTVTLNPSIDYFVFLEEKLIEGSIARANITEMRAGGKGINISLVLSSIGVRSKAVLFLGGCIGALIEKEVSAAEGIDVVKVKIDEENRINIKINNQTETAINAIGPAVTMDQQNDLLSKLANLESNDYVLVSGSFCKGVGVDLVEKIAIIVSKAKAKLITDIPNLKVSDYKIIKPYLVKPNLEELADIFDEKVNEINYREYADKLIDIGIENVLVSMGEGGSYFANESGKSKIIGPEVEVVNTVGCGDSMLAYTIAAIANNLDIIESVKYGEAAGRAKAKTKEFPTLSDVKEIYNKVIVEKIK